MNTRSYATREPKGEKTQGKTNGNGDSNLLSAQDDINGQPATFTDDH